MTEDQVKDNGEGAAAKELAREFRWFEFGSLFINGSLAIIAVIALCIYNGQLKALLESNRFNREALQSVQRAFVTFSPKAEAGTFVKLSLFPALYGWNLMPVQCA